MIRSGAVAYELTRPIDLYALWYVRAVALRTAPTVLRAVPMTVFAMLVLPLVVPEWRLAPPVSLAAGVAFAATLAGALLVSCAITTLVNISLMWTLGGEGVAFVTTATVSLLSGMLIPLPFLPDAVQTLVAWLPFAGLCDQPYRIYTGDLAVAEAPLVIARQLGWVAVLVVFGRLALARGMRRLVVQGG